jgi:hypothetical protein
LIDQPFALAPSPFHLLLWFSDTLLEAPMREPSEMSPPRFAALRVRPYRQYFALSLLSMVADNIEHVISYWVMFQAFHSPALAGFAVISHWVPFLLF